MLDSHFISVYCVRMSKKNLQPDGRVYVGTWINRAVYDQLQATSLRVNRSMAAVMRHYLTAAMNRQIKPKRKKTRKSSG